MRIFANYTLCKMSIIANLQTSQPWMHNHWTAIHLRPMSMHDIIHVVRFLDRSTPPHIATLILIAGISRVEYVDFPALAARHDRLFRHGLRDDAAGLSGYLAVTAVLQIFIGPISDSYGPQACAAGRVGHFCGREPWRIFRNVRHVFLAFRMLQAAVATGIVLSRAIVRDMVPQAQAASMIGYVTMGMALVPMVGPMIGGAIDQFFGWHATFLFLTVAGSAVLVLCYFDLGETGQAAACRFASN